MNDLNEQFSQIYDQYIEKIYRFVYLKVNSQEIAEDITSRVFLKGWEAYKNNQEPIQNIRAFLYKIARNTIIDHYRDTGRTKIVTTDYVAQIADNKTNLYEKAILNSDIEMVKSALQNIKKDYQDVIIWHYLEDIPIAEIAEIIDKPAVNVRVMLHRGLKSLKDEVSNLS